MDEFQYIQSEYSIVGKHMKDGELLRAKRVFDMDGLILVPERFVVASI